MPRPRHVLGPVRLFCAAPQQPGSFACTFMTGLFRKFLGIPASLAALDRPSGGLRLALFRVFCSLILLYRLARLVAFVGGQSLPMSKRSTIRSISLRLDLLAFGCLRRPSGTSAFRFAASAVLFTLSSFSMLPGWPLSGILSKRWAPALLQVNRYHCGLRVINLVRTHFTQTLPHGSLPLSHFRYIFTLQRNRLHN
ncbi:hypothetical protein EDD16DRAFT_1607154 [Pisolithus croceorrhizus]|nr:hypothetical protein EDD16DRAFT_1607154 [Pisolithus croceorrhizus]KAI6132890.1 hypothetical protein EV401DRAFT_1914803 [Pisolithus croceorrhizus]